MGWPVYGWTRIYFCNFRIWHILKWLRVGHCFPIYLNTDNILSCFTSPPTSTSKQRRSTLGLTLNHCHVHSGDTGKQIIRPDPDKMLHWTISDLILLCYSKFITSTQERIVVLKCYNNQCLEMTAIKTVLLNSSVRCYIWNLGNNSSCLEASL